MDRHRKHDVILISDSNVRVRPSYLRETACYLAEPGVGLVSNLFAGMGEQYSGAVMENLQLNGFIAGGVAGAAVLRITCVVGKSMLMPVAALEAIGGFAAVRNLLAEDQAIGVRVRQAGYSIRLSHHVIDNVNRRRSFRWFLNRHSRWYKIRRQMALPAFVAEPAANLTTVGLVWAFSGESGIAWGGLLFLVGLGIVRDAIQTRWLRGSFPKLRHLLYSPVKDILLLSVWFDAIFNRRVRWRGHSFLVGRMTRLRRARVPRQVRRRVRRVRQLRNQQGTRPAPSAKPSIEVNRPTTNPGIDSKRSAD
jgi:ceramide glucosyltransferase